MTIADVDGDGLIDYNEFVAATMHLSKLEKEELLQKVGRGRGRGREQGAPAGRPAGALPPRNCNEAVYTSTSLQQTPSPAAKLLGRAQRRSHQF
jgi:hypothetical protein